ncbi:MAG TPA: hypothetical protein VLZ83_16965 [Edaphocola sp.]|nr:hypothetical protein [Edaphocola sp.]
MFSTVTKTIITIFLFISTFNSFGQGAKKETILRYKNLTSLSIDSLKTKSYSDLARELSIEEFMSFYIENGKEKISKKYGKEYIDSLYTDSIHTFYVQRASSYPIDFMKTKTSDMNNINISEIDGNLIRQQFIEEIVSYKDKERVKRRSKNCNMGYDYWEFKYSYNRTTRLVEVK